MNELHLFSGERILSNVGEVAKNAEVVAFLGMMLFAGVFWGFIEAFLFWHLDDLGASRALMGWTVAVGMVTSLPFLIFSGPITDTIGHMNVIILGMLAYTGRMLGYSFISQAAYVYPFEALEGLTMALMMTSAVTYVAKISTPTTIASVMGRLTSKILVIHLSPSRSPCSSLHGQNVNAAQFTFTLDYNQKTTNCN